MLDLTTKVMTPLTQDPDNGMYPSWSPDGQQIAFMSWRNGRTQIFTMTADGKDQKPLVTLASGSAIDPRWSPDGRHIVFVQVRGSDARVAAGQQTAARDLYRRTIASGKVTRLSR